MTDIGGVYTALRLGNKYNREQVHDIFDLNSPFKSGTGTWGLQGIVKVPNRVKDYVFFVTFGQSQAGHEFKEEITDDGKSWVTQTLLIL